MDIGRVGGLGTSIHASSPKPSGQGGAEGEGMTEACPISFTFEIERYSRCYPRQEEQFKDSNGAPLYTLIPTMQATLTPMSQTMGPLMQSRLWSALPALDGLGLELTVGIVGAEACRLMVVARRDESVNLARPGTPTNSLSPERPIILERLCFPESFAAGFKLSAKPKSLGVKYTRRHPDQPFLFQVIFKEEFNCRLCHEILYRCGLLTPAWPRLVEMNFGTTPEGRVELGTPAPQTSDPTARQSDVHPPAAPTAKSGQDEFLCLATIDSQETIIEEEHPEAAMARSASPTPDNVIMLSSETERIDVSDPAVRDILDSQERARRLILGLSPTRQCPSTVQAQQSSELDVDFGFLRQASYDQLVIE